MRPNASEDVVYHYVRFPARTLLSTSLAGANRDPEAFEDPDIFDITHERDTAQMTFGAGTYSCAPRWPGPSCKRRYPLWRAACRDSSGAARSSGSPRPSASEDWPGFRCASSPRNPRQPGSGGPDL